jgi:hypothetical protein
MSSASAWSGRKFENGWGAQGELLAEDTVFLVFLRASRSLRTSHCHLPG